MKSARKIALLFRELAAAFDQLDAETEPKKRPRLPRDRADAVAEEAAQRVREGLRRQGIEQ